MSETEDTPSGSSLDEFLNSLEKVNDERLIIQKKSELYRTFYYRYGEEPVKIGDKDYFQRVRTRALPQEDFQTFWIREDLDVEPVYDNGQLREREILDKDGNPLLYIVSVPVIETVEAILTPHTIIGTTDLTSCTGIWTHKKLETGEICAMLSHIQLYNVGSIDNFIKHASKKGYPQENIRLLLPSHEESDLAGFKNDNYSRDYEIQFKQQQVAQMQERNIEEKRIWKYRQPWIVGDSKLTPAVILTSEGFSLYSAGQNFASDTQFWREL